MNAGRKPPRREVAPGGWPRVRESSETSGTRPRERERDRPPLRDVDVGVASISRARRPGAAKAGRIVIITANSPEFVAAKAGAAKTFGTNPLCFACPVEGREPFVFDMSTAAIALFGVLTCKAKGLPLPEKSAYDADGNFTTKVEDIPVGGGQGAIAGWGGHKGVGIALMVELLCAALAGGAVLGKEKKGAAKNWGHHIVCIDPAAHVDGFEARAASIIKTIAESHPDGVRLPGDASNKIAATNAASGTIPVPKKIWDVICETAASAK